MGTRLAHTPRSRCHPQMGRRHRLARPPPHKPPPKQLGLTLHQLFLSFNPAGGPGRCVCRWVAARPLAVRAASFARRVGSKPGQAPPPPTGTAAGPSGALHTGGAWLLMCYGVRCFEARPGPAPRRVPYPQFRMQFPDTCSSSLSEKPGISTITFQSMKCVWGNCMRICADRAPPPPTGTAAWSLYSLGASRGGSCVEFLGCSGPCCYERRQSEEFFVWISAPLLRTSSIRGLFR